MKRNQDKQSFEDAAHSLFGCLAQSISFVVPVAAILAYAFSSQFRSMISFWKLAAGVGGWIVIAPGLWWMRRDIVG